MILAERNARVMAEANAAVVKAEAANAPADLSSSEALNAYLKLEIEKLRRELYGSRVGTGLPASSKTAGSASRTMQPSVLFEHLP
jgi:hypothetical protein